jgi:hypothetical protein
MLRPVLDTSRRLSQPPGVTIGIMRTFRFALPILALAMLLQMSIGQCDAATPPALSVVTLPAFESYFPQSGMVTDAQGNFYFGGTTGGGIGEPNYGPVTPRGGASPTWRDLRLLHFPLAGRDYAAAVLQRRLHRKAKGGWHAYLRHLPRRRYRERHGNRACGRFRR